MGKKKFSMTIAICVHVPAAASLLITELYVPVTPPSREDRAPTLLPEGQGIKDLPALKITYLKSLNN